MQGIWKLNTSSAPCDGGSKRNLILNDNIRQALQVFKNGHDLFRRKAKFIGLSQNPEKLKQNRFRHKQLGVIPEDAQGNG